MMPDQGSCAALTTCTSVLRMCHCIVRFFPSFMQWRAPWLLNKFFGIVIGLVPRKLLCKQEKHLTVYNLDQRAAICVNASPLPLPIKDDTRYIRQLQLSLIHMPVASTEEHSFWARPFLWQKLQVQNRNFKSPEGVS
eukprot:500092-Pelagomonas_calceolata.AAC.16